MNVKQITTVNKELNIIGATLLSEEEAKTLLTKEEREYTHYWWLRTPSYDRNYARYVINNGEVSSSYSGYVSFNKGVRPALIIDISETPFKVGDVFELREYRFKILSPTLAWMYEQDLGRYCFDNKTNVYEKSSIKEFVDEWFASLTKE